MAIKEANGTIVINHAVTPVTLNPISKDDGKGIEIFEFSDSSLTSNHLFSKRDLGRTVSSDGQVVHKGKFSVITEAVTAAGKRRTLVTSVTTSAHADFTTQQNEGQIRDLGQFLLDNAADIAAGRISS